MEIITKDFIKERTYWDIAENAFDDAMFGLENSRFRMAGMFFHKFAEMGAKALLGKTDPQHNMMSSRAVGLILLAYDPEGYAANELADRAGYLTSLFFNTQAPGIGYIECTQEHAKVAHDAAVFLRKYYEGELAK